MTTNQPNQSPDRRRFLGFGLKALAYVAPVITTLAVPALVPDEGPVARAQMGQAGMRPVMPTGPKMGTPPMHMPAHMKRMMKMMMMMRRRHHHRPGVAR